MNILLSIHHKMSKNAGAPGVTYQLFKEYEQLGHNVMLFSFDSLPSYVPEKFKMLLFPFYLSRQINRLIKANTLDVIDASTGDAWIWSILRRKKIRTVLVTRSHGLEHSVHENLLEEKRLGNVKLSWKYPFYHGGIRLWEVAVSLRRADGSLFLNNHDMKYAVEQLQVKEASSQVIGNGLPDYFLNLPVINHLNSKIHTIRIAQVGSYIQRKGILYTARAMNNILEKYPNVELSFIGTGCSREKVLADYHSAVHERIHVISQYDHEELPSLLQNHHIKLFATLSEGFPLGLIEAMACGLAPITSYGPATFIQDGWDALIIPPRSSPAIEEKVETLINNPDLLFKLQVNAYETAQEYKWSQIACDTIEYYKQLYTDSKVLMQA
ncbi:MAG: glycosyltransferase family 4 protein [Candidatus Pristimantibacillus sp.]